MDVTSLNFSLNFVKWLFFFYSIRVIFPCQEAFSVSAPAANPTGSDPGTSLPEVPDMITKKNGEDATANKLRPPNGTNAETV